MIRTALLLVLATGCTEPDGKETGDTDTDTGEDTGDTGDTHAATCWDGVGEVGIEVGDCAPDFTLVDGEGTQRSLSEHAGDIIIVDCSAMW